MGEQSFDKAMLRMDLESFRQMCQQHPEEFSALFRPLVEVVLRRERQIGQSGLLAASKAWLAYLDTTNCVYSEEETRLIKAMADAIVEIETTPTSP